MGLFDGTPLEQPVLCQSCKRDIALCQCPSAEAVVELDPSRQQLTIALEKRRRGKTVTTVRGLEGSPAQIDALLTELKNSCGAGGTAADRVLEIQGDQRQRVAALLASKHYRRVTVR